LRRLFSVAFLADFQLYLIYTALPFKALQLGAGPFELGALAALSTGSYALLVAVFGHLSDRFPRPGLARLSCIGFILACIGFTLAPDLKTLCLCAPLAGGSMAPFWPSVQASVADHASRSGLERQLGRFNLCWSSGKGAGFLVGGAIVAAWGVGATFTLGSAIAFSIFFFLLPNHVERREARDGAAAEGLDRSVDVRAAPFRRISWIANGVAFGVGATLNHHYPRLVQEFGWSPKAFGMFLGLTYLVQTLTFAALMVRPERWCFRRTPLYAAQALLLVAVLALPFADLARVVVVAFVVGAGLGTCYYSSIVYSMHTAAGRGRNAGVHEGLIGLGSMLIPFLGGVGARQLEALWAPYVVAAAALGTALLVEEVLYRSSSRHRLRAAT
jgi:MFS family permease